MLTFTNSKDGVKRANVRLTHRIDLQDIATAAAKELDDKFSALEDTTELFIRKATILTGAEMEASLRDMLWQYGSDRDFICERTVLHGEGMWEQVYEACLARAKQIWKEVT